MTRYFVPTLPHVILGIHFYLLGTVCVISGEGTPARIAYISLGVKFEQIDIFIPWWPNYAQASKDNKK